MLVPYSAGRLYGARSDIATQTPRQFGALQNVSIQTKFTTKPLQGKNQFALFIARGEAKMTLKAEVGVFSGKLFNDIFYGATLATGGTQLAVDEAHSVPSSSPYTISPTNQSTFAGDEGAFYNPGGAPLALVSVAPTVTATYEAPANPSTTGVYTFSSSDASAKVLLNYLYTTTAGENIAITNSMMGMTPTFSGVFRGYDPSTGLFATLTINRMTCDELSMDAKLGDWQLSSFSMEAFDDGTGNIGILTLGDAT